MVWLKNYQNNIYTTSLAATSLCFNRSKKWVINTRPGDLGSKTAKQLYNSYQICSDHFEDSQYMDPAHVTDATHNFDRFYMKAETIKLYWNRPDFALDDHDVEAACCRALSFWRPMNAATQARRLSMMMWALQH